MDRRLMTALAVLAAVLALAFAPYLLGRSTLLYSSADVPSLYPAGAAPQPAFRGYYRTTDPGAPGWQSEPWLATEHRIVVEQHRMPWWNPYDGFGQPFAAAQIPQPFYPLTFLAALAPGPVTYNWLLVVRLLLCGAFAAAFVRLFTASRAAVATAGLAASLSGYYVIFIAMPHLSAEVLLPAMLWAVERLARRPTARNVAVLALVWAAVNLGGMPESTVIVALAALWYAAFRLPLLGVRGALSLAGAFALGTAAAAIMLVPLAELLGASFNTHQAGDAAGHPFGLDADALPLSRALLLALAPLAYGLPLYDIGHGGSGFTGLRGYVGTCAALLALVALGTAIVRRSRWSASTPAFALAAFAALEFAKHIGAAWIQPLGRLPVLRLVIFPKYGEAAFDVAIALLAGLGVAAVAERRAAGPVVAAAALLVLAALSAGYLAATDVLIPDASIAVLYYACGVALACAVPLAAIAYRGSGRVFAIAAPAAIATELCAAYLVPVFYRADAPPPASRNPYAGAPYVRALQRLAPPGGARIVAFGSMLYADWAGAFGLADARALNGLYPGTYFTYLQGMLRGAMPVAGGADLGERFTGAEWPPPLMDAAARRWLDLSSIRYVVTPPGTTLALPRVRLIYDADARIWENLDALPRAYVAHDIDDVAQPAAQVDALRARSFAPAREIVADAPPLRSGGSIDPARVEAADAESTVVRTRSAREGMLVLTDTYWPGWNATVDGRAAPIARVDGLFRGVRVPAGAHVVAFRYASRADGAGLWITLAALAACIVLCALPGGARQAASADLELPLAEEVRPAAGQGDDAETVRAAR